MTYNIHTRNGFTLVELAIALMVIGLLIGGVLKGQELIENARVTQTVRILKAVDAATLIFRNTYGALPGDIKKPNRIPNCTSDLCNVGGNGNGKIRDGDVDPAYVEPYNFFPHLTKVGMLKGPEGSTTADADNVMLYAAGNGYEGATNEMFFLAMPFDTIQTTRVQYLSGRWNGHYIWMYIVPAKYLAALDQKMDDGMPNTGDVFLEDYGLYTSGTCRIGDAGDSTEEYDVAGTGDCVGYFGTSF